MQQINKITIIGAGNMGGSIARGIVSSGYTTSDKITITRSSENKLNEWINKGFNATTDNRSAVEEVDLLILAVKPYLIAKVTAEFKDLLNDKQLIVSVAANVTLHDLEECVGADKKLFRLLPNTAIAVQESMTCMSFNENASQDSYLVEKLFEKLGEVAVLPENQIVAATALASCGTAFAMRYLRAAMIGGIEMGLKAPQARFMAAQTVKGAAELLLQGTENPETEIDKVCTPAGVTIKGLNALEHQGFSSAVIKSLLASFNAMR
ncbi:MAG: pyrroline-5-carboxylate reductase [Mangrovibacterium sp.]